MSRLDPPIVIDDLRWDAVEFRTGYKPGSPPKVWFAFCTPKKKNGEWSMKQTRVWPAGSGITRNEIQIPPEVVLAGLYAWLRDNEQAAERIDAEHDLIMSAIADMERGA